MKTRSLHRYHHIYIPKEESKGGNHARNVGILRAKGEYIAFLDDDDEWLPEKTEKQVRYLQEHPECGVVACFNIVEFNFKDRYPENRDGMMEGDVHQRIFTWIPFTTSVAMYRKMNLLDVGMFDENLRFWQETELNIRMAQVMEFGCVHEELSLYRVIDKDINRLSHQLDGWIDAVAYIEKKHEKLIQALPEDMYRQHCLLVAQDGAKRAERVGNRRMERIFRLQVFRYEFTLKNCIKALFTNKGYELIRNTVKK